MRIFYKVWRTAKAVTTLTVMRIGIDARFYGSIGKGLGRYTSELITHLEKVDDENEYVIFLRKENWDEYVPKNPHFTKVLADIPWYGFKEQLLLPPLLRRQQLDLMHFPHFNVPVFYRRPIVVTIHDLILLHFPTPRASTLGPLIFKIKFVLYKAVITSALKRARKIFAVSEHTKAEILKTFPFTKQNPPVVTYPACGSPFSESVERTAPVVDVQGPYMLYVGNAYPHKNLNQLLKAFKRFREEYRNDYHLVLVGGKDYFTSRLQDEAEDATNVNFFGYATDEELAGLYDKAAFYIFPSLYEGFGLPPLEAMCRNIPVTSSKASCMPEILGDAAHYFDPEDIDDMIRAMNDLASNGELRNALMSKGTQRAYRYNWHTTAKQTLSGYRSALPQQTTQ